MDGKFLFLRGQVPTDRDPKQIMFSNIINCDDMWTQLAYNLSKNGYGEIWYWGGKRGVVYKDYFVERWLPSFKKILSDFKPDVIFARGGFKEYDQVLNRNPQAFKIYYGAGRRFMPRGNFTNYNLILVDTHDQLQQANTKFPKIKCSLFIKPCAENVFKPSLKVKKDYDIILVGNYSPKVNKGHDFAFNIIPPKYRIVSVGKVPKSVRRKYPHIHFTGWIPRKNIPSFYGRSKVSIICCGTIDSCPRIVPESLACNCPILILDRVNFWKEKYINEKAGMVTTKNNFLKDLNYMINNYDNYSPHKYYVDNLSIESSVNDLLKYVR